MAITAGAFLGDTGTAGQASSTTISLTTVAPVAAGAFVVLGVSWYSNTITLLSVADNASGGSSLLTYTIAKQGAPANPASANTAIVYAQAPSGLASGSVITATFSASIDVRGLTGFSLAGVATSSPVDVVSGPTGINPASTGWSTASVAIAAGSVLVAYAFNETNSFTNTITSPSVEVADFVLGSGWTTQVLAYRIEPSAGSYTVAGTWSGSGQTGLNAVAFKAAVGGTNATVTAVVADAVVNATPPTVAASASVVSPPADAVSASTPPTVAALASVTVPPADATGGALAPVVSAGATVIAPPADATGQAPPVSGIVSSVVNAPATLVAGSALPPVVDTASSATVASVATDGVGGLVVPVVSAGATTAPPNADGTGAGLPPSMAFGATVAAPPASAVAGPIVPFIAAGGGLIVDVPIADGTVSVPAPLVSASRTVGAVGAAGAGGAPLIVILTGGTIVAVPAFGLGDATAAVITGLMYGIYTGTGRSPAGRLLGSSSSGRVVAPAGRLRP